MNNNFIPFALPEIDDDDIAEVVDTLKSGWLTTGPKCKQFEASFAAFLGSGVEAIAVNSATAGLHLALEAIGVGPGDEVITTTHTFTATAEVIRYLGADPVFVDIDLDSYCIDVTKIEQRITSKTKAIVPVHFGGLSADMTTIIDIARRHQLRVIEDAAHALPCTHDKVSIGMLSSDATVFSFYANKTMTTGEGGMLVTRDRAIAERARVMRLHGISRDAFDRFTSTKPSWYYEVIAPGFKYNMTDVAASLGIQQLKKANDFQKKRAAIAQRYFNELKDLPIVLPPAGTHGDLHSWHLFVIRLADSVIDSRDAVIQKLYDGGIGVSVHYIPLHLHPYWRDTYGLVPEMFPVSQGLYERSLSLPIYSKMSDSEVDKVVHVLRDVLASK